MQRMRHRLRGACDDFFDFLSTAPIEDDLWLDEKEAFKAPLESYLRHFLSDVESPSVDPSYVLNALDLDKSSPAGRVVYLEMLMANLTLLFDDLQPQPQSLMAVLQKLEQNFPGAYVPDNPEFHDARTNEQLANQTLLIRTQQCIYKLQRRCGENAAPFNPLQGVAEQWCHGDFSLEAVKAFVRDRNKDALQLKPLTVTDSEDTKERNATRFASICRLLPDTEVQGSLLDLKELQGTYSVEEFIGHSIEFIKTIYGKIKASISQDSSLIPAPAQVDLRAGSQIHPQLETESIAGFHRQESQA